MKYVHLHQVAEVLQCALPFDQPLASFVVDSRSIQPNDLFFALKGDVVDGHAFLRQAAEKGASGAVIDKDYIGPDYGLCLLRTDNPLESLQKLARQSLSSFKGQIIGITGSLGKTTTKEFLYTILKDRFRVTCSPGNHNSQIGLPLTLLNHVNGDEEFIILEMGMTKSGHLKQLVSIAPPDIAIITSIALVHAENFNSIEGIKSAKCEILSHPKTKWAIVPDSIEEIGSSKKIPLASINARTIPEEHLRHNFKVAASCALFLGMSSEEIESVIPRLPLMAGRGKKMELKGVVFIDDSYNAAVESIAAALNYLPLPAEKGKRIAVIGELAEFGSFSESAHQEVAKLSLERVDQMFCLGKGCAPIIEMWKKEGRLVAGFSSRAELVDALRNEAQPGDVVLLKGANRNQLWKILEEF